MHVRFLWQIHLRNIFKEYLWQIYLTASDIYFVGVPHPSLFARLAERAQSLEWWLLPTKGLQRWWKEPQLTLLYFAKSVTQYMSCLGVIVACQLYLQPTFLFVHAIKKMRIWIMFFCNFLWLKIVLQVVPPCYWLALLFSVFLLHCSELLLKPTSMGLCSHYFICCH